MPLPNISIDNFRAFKEKCEFQFAPITILTGTNSSGKSSLVDAVRILKNYADEMPDADSDKFWNKIIDFKQDYLHSRIPNFKDLVNYETRKDNIAFEFKCQFVGMAEVVTVCLEFGDKDGINGILKSLKYKDEDGSVLCSIVIKEDALPHIEIDFAFFYEKFDLEIEKEIRYYDGILKRSSTSILILPDPFEIYYPHNETENKLIFREAKINKIQYDKIKKELKKGEPYYDIISYPNKRKHSAIKIANEDKVRLKKILKQELCVDIVVSDNILHHLNRLISYAFTDPIGVIEFSRGQENAILDENINYIYSSDEVRNFVWKYFDPNILDCDTIETISDLGTLFYDKFVYANICNSLMDLQQRLNFEYIPSIRNNPDRFYAKKSGGYFENILADFIEKNPLTNEQIKIFLDSNLQRFELGHQLFVERHSDFAIYSVYLDKRGRKINLMDFGYGISQVMPILLQIALTAHEGKTKTIIIEEPETNLHPALQSKLADMFIEANRLFGIDFVIETHSEYLIRKLQYLTATGDIKLEDTQLYYFYHPDNIPEGEPQVKKINIDDRGALSDDFGAGFFDEADKIAMSIWSMNQSQSN